MRCQIRLSAVYTVQLSTDVQMTLSMIMYVHSRVKEFRVHIAGPASRQLNCMAIVTFGYPDSYNACKTSLQMLNYSLIQFPFTMSDPKAQLNKVNKLTPP